MSHSPPYTITPTIINYISQISESLGRISTLKEMKELRLRRINKIRTIQGSLAIEGNTLTQAQVQTILEGKTVVAPPREIQEVHNAIKAYDAYPRWNPSSEKDLLEAHKLLTSGLIDTPGSYRKKGAGVMGKEHVIHVAPPAEMVPSLMKNLITWLKETNNHPLIISSVFHYEFEFIHPFEDGNGRLGRLWQTLILSRWNNLFHDIPIESMIYRRQQEYYQAINDSSNSGESTSFIEFMLETIYKEIQETTQEKILRIIKTKPEITRKELAEHINISVNGVKYHLDKMRNAGIIVHRGSTKKGYWEIL